MQDRTMHVGRLLVALALGAYLAPYLWDFQRYGFLDHLDLAIHEAGHPLFSPFGEFAAVAGGTLLQLLVPAAFVAYFWWTGQRWSACVVLLWVAQSLFNVARYAADARAHELPLVGGEFVIHDWGWMLSRLHLLTRDQQVAAVFRTAGGLAYAVGVGGALVGALDPARLRPREEARDRTADPAEKPVEGPVEGRGAAGIPPGPGGGAGGNAPPDAAAPPGPVSPPAGRKPAGEGGEGRPRVWTATTWKEGG